MKIRPVVHEITRLIGRPLKQEGLAVASIARDDPSPLPGMHREHNAPACTAGALWAATTMRGKFGSEFET